jgi:hypothetical protein
MQFAKGLNDIVTVLSIFVARFQQNWAFDIYLQLCSASVSVVRVGEFEDTV